LLQAAGIAVVPFDAFGAGHATDWYRLSVGACGLADLDAAFDRLQAALATLQRP
jgi:aspartate aminotransferase